MRRALVPFALIFAFAFSACGGAPDKPADADGARDRAAAEDRDLQRKLDDSRRD